MSRHNSLEQNRQKSLQVWTQAQRQALHEAVKNTPVAPVAAAASGTGSGGVTNGLQLVWDDIANVPVADATNLTDWNNYFGNNFFSAVTVLGNTVNLIPSGTVEFAPNLFSPGKSGNQHLIQIIDKANCVTSVGVIAVANCHSLTTVILPACTYLGFAAFENCENLVSVDFSSVEEIAELALGDLHSLTALDMPKLKTAGVYAFAWCYNMVTFTAPLLEGTLGVYTFLQCNSLISINLPLVTYLGNNCFDGCTSLTSVNLPLLQHTSEYSFNYCYALTAISLPSLATSAYRSFSDCSGLESVNLPLLTSIGDECFYSCSSLKTINIPSCVSLGSTTGNNNVFKGAEGHIVSLTINPSRMTCNGGSPDGDIVSLGTNNTLTVNGTPYP